LDGTAPLGFAEGRACVVEGAGVAVATGDPAVGAPEAEGAPVEALREGETRGPACTILNLDPGAAAASGGAGAGALSPTT
jgi:hypothetical protein